MRGVSRIFLPRLQKQPYSGRFSASLFYRGQQSFRPIRLLPGKVQIRTAKVAVSGGLTVDRAAQVQPFNDCCGPEVKDLLYSFAQLFV